MEKFFNLSFLKYPITLIINMILVGFYLYIFPAKATTKARENEFAAINLEIPSADKKIEEKNTFNHENGEGNDDFSAAEIAQNERITLDNSRSDFIIRTSKSSHSTKNYQNSVSHKAVSNRPYESVKYQPQNQPNQSYYHTLNADKNPENKSPYQENHERTIEKLSERIKELEERKRQSVASNNTGTGVSDVKKQPNDVVKNGLVNDGFSFQDKDLIPKINADTELSNPILNKVSNYFYSNKKGHETERMADFIPNTPSTKASKSPTSLIKGKLLESKIVRNNSTIKIMITETKMLANVAFEAGDIIGAKTSIRGDRLILSVEGFLKNDSFLPLAAEVMDMDGMLGLKVSIDAENEMQKQAWGQNVGSTLGSVNPLLVYNPQGNLGQTVGNQVVGSLVNQSLNGANQYVNAKMRDVKVSIKTGQQLFLLIKN